MIAEVVYPGAALPDVEHWSEDWTLDTGERVRVRAIRPGDAPLEQAFVRSLSQESRYSRFMGDVRELSAEMLERFTHIHYPHDLALIVTIIEAGREREIAVARYIQLPDRRSCEYAIVVADAWQHHGLGHRLMQALMRFAREGGIERMEGYVLAENHAMLDMMRSLGFKCGPSEDGPQVRTVALEFGAAPAANLAEPQANHTEPQANFTHPQANLN